MIRPKSGGPFRPGKPRTKPNAQEFHPYPNNSGRGGFQPRGGINSRGGRGNLGIRRDMSRSMDSRYPPPPPPPPPPPSRSFSNGPTSFRGRPVKQVSAYNYGYQPTRPRPDFQYKNFNSSDDKNRSSFNSGANNKLKQNSDIPEQREYPCRCLFVRNIEKFTASERDITDLFSGYGELKFIKEKISDNGVAYITFFDLRAAETARNELNSQNFKGRLLDVHFSFPNPFSDRSQPPQHKDNQGSLKLFFRRCEFTPTQSQLYDHFSQFGEIADIQSTNNAQVCILSYFDSRACIAALERSELHIIQGGEVTISLAWDKFAPITKEDQFHNPPALEHAPQTYSTPISESNPRPRHYPPKKSGPQYNENPRYSSNSTDSFGFRPPSNTAALGPLSTQELIEKAQQAQNILDYIKTQTSIKLPETTNNYYNTDSFRPPSNPTTNNTYYQPPQNNALYNQQGYYNQNPPPAPSVLPQAPSPYGYGTTQQPTVPPPPPPPPQPYYAQPAQQYPTAPNSNMYGQHHYSQALDPNNRSHLSNTSLPKDAKSNPEVNQLLQLLAQANSKHGRN